MKRLGAFAAVLMLLCCGCAADASVVGTWVSDDNPNYYFELYADHTCFMFDAEDEWVSSGIYRVERRQLVFETDTGTFVWARTEDGMVFEAGDRVTVYRLESSGKD